MIPPQLEPDPSATNALRDARAEGEDAWYGVVDRIVRRGTAAELVALAHFVAESTEADYLWAAFSLSHICRESVEQRAKILELTRSAAPEEVWQLCVETLRYAVADPSPLDWIADIRTALAQRAEAIIHSSGTPKYSLEWLVTVLVECLEHDASAHANESECGFALELLRRELVAEASDYPPEDEIAMALRICGPRRVEDWMNAVESELPARAREWLAAVLRTPGSS